VLTSLFYGWWFWRAGYGAWTVVAFSFAGSLLAFMRFNLSRGKQKIFLGDTGSLIVGLVISALTVRFLEYDHIARETVKIGGAPVVAMAVVILPLTDTLRVVVIRLFKGRSPFLAERSHIHHVLIRKGLSHRAATAILLSVNVLFVAVMLALQGFGERVMFTVLLGLSLIFLLALSVLNRNGGTGTIS
jgi:UDP-N-acetylmuramyl pentapeptide phosphotransferase/UDP-N-acetylglucosamine-1-phosphate transferase